MYPGRQWVMPQGPEFLLLTWKTKLVSELLALAWPSPACRRHLGSKLPNENMWSAPWLNRLIFRLAALAHWVLVPVRAPDSVPVAPLPGQLSGMARECSGGWPKSLGPAPAWETRKSTWLLASDQRDAPAAAHQLQRPFEGEPIVKKDLSLCVSL